MNFTGASFDQEAILAIKESAVFDKPYIKKSAWIGNIQEELHAEIRNFSRRELPVFRSAQQAIRLVGEIVEYQFMNEVLQKPKAVADMAPALSRPAVGVLSPCLTDAPAEKFKIVVADDSRVYRTIVESVLARKDTRSYLRGMVLKL